MALVFKDRVRETSTTTGTGNMLLSASVFNFVDWDVIGVNNTTYYAIVHRSNSQYEIGLGTYIEIGAGIIQKYLSRDTVLASSVTNNLKVDFTFGTKDVFTTYPAARAVDTTKAEETAIQFAIALG